MRELSRIQSTLDTFHSLEQQTVDLSELSELVDDDAAFLSELEQGVAALLSSLEEMEHEQFLSGDDDDKSVLVQISAGQGGLEAQDWALMLSEMVERFCVLSGLPVSVEGRETASKAIYMEVDGKAYGLLKALHGVHRIMRISPYGTSGDKRQTSFAAIDVVPMGKELKQDIVIDRSRLLRETFRAGGNGGQNVNKVETAVRLTYDFVDDAGTTHTIVAKCQDGRSQHSNEQGALLTLKNKIAMLLQRQEEERMDKLNSEKKQNGFGGQIMTYSFHPYLMVKDHRTGYIESDVYEVMNGRLEGVVNAFLRS